MARGNDISSLRPLSQKPLTFVLQSNGSVSGLNKSSINAHIARRTHRLNREKQKRPNDHRNEAYNKIRTESASQLVAKTSFGDYGPQFFSASPVFLAGNSDPFSCKAIPITAEINHLISFTRDFILPAFHNIESSVADGRFHMNHFWEDITGSLNNQEGCIGYAYLAHSAAVMADIVINDQATSLLAMELRTLATSKLTRRNASFGVWDVYALFCAEIAASRFNDAAIHGQMLRHLLQPGRNELPVLYSNPEPRLLMAVLREDITRACLSLTRPSFDLHRWTAENLPTRILDSIEHGEAHSSLFPQQVKLNVWLTGHIREIFLHIREWLHALGVIILNPGLCNLTLIGYGAMSIMVQEGHLVNYYLDCLNLWHIDGSREALEDACMSLAALYWTRRAAHENLGKGSSLELAGCYAFDMSSIAVRQLRHLHKLLEMDEKEWFTSRRLWTTYVGTLAERVVESRIECGEYHRVRFRHLATTLSFGDSVQGSLKAFLYADVPGLEFRLR